MNQEAQTLRQFIDFSLKIDYYEGSYWIHLTNSPYGSCKESIKIAFFEEDLESISNTWREQIPVSGKESATNLNAKALGKQLYRSIFCGPIANRFLQSLGHVNGQEAASLRLRLEIPSGHPKLRHLANLPWESLYRPETDTFLARDINIGLIRHVNAEVLHTPPPLEDSALRILIIDASTDPKKAFSIPEKEEATENPEIADFLKLENRNSNLKFSILKRPTIENLRKEIKRSSPHILHFIGHGGIDHNSGRGVLKLRSSFETETLIGGHLLADTLRISPSLCLVFLNSCNGGDNPRAQNPEHFRGVATSLIDGGIFAVIAMQFSISSYAAKDFSTSFYEALASSHSIELAVIEGRNAILGNNPSSLEWITPALYMRTDHTSLFRPSVSNRSKRSLAKILQAARSFLDLGQHKHASRILMDLIDSGTLDGDAFYLRALSRLGGQRPRKLPFDQIKRIEMDLQTATELAPGKTHFYLIWALIKEDYYLWNGLRSSSPGIEKLLDSAVRGEIERAELERLSTQAKGSEGNVAAKIKQLLES